MNKEDTKHTPLLFFGLAFSRHPYPDLRFPVRLKEARLLVTTTSAVSCNLQFSGNWIAGERENGILDKRSRDLAVQT